LKIRVANYAGFCEGVRRAVGMALDMSQKSRKPLYTCGALIHNPQVITLLRKKGIRDISDLSGAREGSLLIRSHGIAPAERRRIEELGIPVVDATCPHVLKIHSIIRKAAGEGASTVIVGDAGHAEVEALLGCAKGKGYVVGSTAEVDSLPELSGRVCVVAQTTQDEEVFNAVADHLKQRFPCAEIHRTVCTSTRLRQDAVRRLASEVDAIVVVGGRNSANTTRLAQIASATGTKTLHIETPKELDDKELEGCETVGVTAGASTPNWIIREVVSKLSRMGRSRRDAFLEPLWVLLRFLALSNIYVAAGAAAFTYAASLLMGVQPDWRYLVIAFASILSLHTVNQYLAAREASQFHTYGRSTVSASMRIACAVVSSGIAVVLACTTGWLETLVVGLGLAVGSVYGMQVAPAAFRRVTGFRSLRDIPASKDIFAAGGWAVLVAGLPAMSAWPDVNLERTVYAFVFIFVMVYVRSTLLDVGEIERDRAVGREATPFVLGKRRTKVLVSILLTGSLVLLLAGHYTGALPGLSLWLCALPVYAGGYLLLYHQRLVTREVSLELLADGKFLLAGVLACAWSALG
jgi:(E)-4-hydroxy-3-methyl-but-2-enyl pyrophosphate reductase